MKKITFKLSEILNLYVEITGIDFLTKEQMSVNLLTENISLSTKYKLFKLVDSLEVEVLNFVKHRSILITSLGELKDDNNYIIPNDKIDDFNKSINDLLGLDIEISFLEINFNEFDNVVTDKIMPFFYKILS